MTAYKIWPRHCHAWCQSVRCTYDGDARLGIEGPRHGHAIALSLTRVDAALTVARPDTGLLRYCMRRGLGGKVVCRQLAEQHHRR